MTHSEIEISDADLENTFQSTTESAGTLVVVGAGASVPTNPVASALEAGLMDACKAMVGDVAQDAEIPKLLSLEVLCGLLKFRLQERIDIISLLWHLLQSDLIPLTAWVQAELMNLSRIKYIFSANFDDLLPRACAGLQVDFRVITQSEIQGAKQAPQVGDIFAFHGTLFEWVPGQMRPQRSPPTSAEARGLATPFSPEVARYISQVADSVSSIVFWGYSGSDYYDMNPALSTAIKENFRGSVKWLCYKGGKENLSPEIKLGETEIASDALFIKFDGDINTPISNFLKYNTHSTNVDTFRSQEDKEWQVQRRETYDRASQFLNALRTFASDDREKASLDRSMRLFIDDIRYQVWKAYIVIEHFHLDAIGLPRRTIGYFGAYSAPGNDSLGKFHGVELSELTTQLAEYWRYNQDGSRERRRKFTHQRSTPIDTYRSTIYKEIEQKLLWFDAEIETVCQQGAGLRPVDRALLRTLQAISTNYLGLLCLRYVEDSLNENETMMREDERINGLTRFRAAADRAADAMAFLAGDVDNADGRLNSLVSADVWAEIALFNVARLSDDDHAIPAMLKVVRSGCARVGREADGFLKLVHSQTVMLRASILLKRVYKVENDHSPPNLMFSELDGERQGIVQEALQTVSEMEAQFRTSTDRKDVRLLGAIDAQVVDALARGNDELANEALSRMHDLIAFRRDDNEKSDIWKNNIQLRFDLRKRGGT